MVTDDNLISDDVRKRRAMIGCGSMLLAGVGVVALGLGLMWWQRVSIAEHFIQRSLTQRDIAANYRVTAIGPQWQRIENVVIGDPRAPDLTADWIEVRLKLASSGAAVSAVRASGVRLRGRVDGNGALSLGALDKFLSDGDTSQPFKLPDLDVAIHDGRMRLDTPYGAVGVALGGTGNIRTGFRGEGAAVMPALSIERCQGRNITGFGAISTRDGALTFKGPLRMANGTCSGVKLSNAEAHADMTLSSEFAGLSGKIVFSGDAAVIKGSALDGLTGQADVSGPFKTPMIRGTLLAKQGRYGAVRAHDIQLAGSTNGSNGNGTITLKRIATNAYASVLRTGAQRAAQTPVGPALAQLQAAIARAGDARLTANWQLASGALSIQSATLSTQSGANLSVAGGTGVQFSSDGLSANTNLSFHGGGFPAFTGQVRHRPDGVTTGDMRIAPYGPNGGQVALSPLRFAVQANGAWRIDTRAKLDGPLPGGAVQGLVLPITLSGRRDGSYVLNRGACTTVSASALRLSNVALGPTQLRLCPNSGPLLNLRNGRITGGADIASPRLAGRLGIEPFTASAHKASFSLSDGRFALSELIFTLGAGEPRTRLEIGQLAGLSSGGRYKHMAGSLASVPLLISEANGSWRYTKNALTMSGSLRVADAAIAARFEPLISTDLALRLANNQIAATATLVTPESKIPVTHVTIAHDLTHGVGDAVLDVPRLSFGRTLQPITLTRLTKGVVDLVEGDISGRGTIQWTPRGVTSAGRFKTETGINFAAAFGPVEGLRAEIVFDDLLALSTPSGQTVFIDSVNSGVAVLGGTVRYRLLPGQLLQVEHGEWPFAGGKLRLDPTLINMGEPVERRLTFQVEGLDAAKFIQQLEFENLSATGVFDGNLPMIFDAYGGRIEGGALKARGEGGTIAYVGDVSNVQMNRFAMLAFDALKSMRYRDLIIDLNGPLDGEIVSSVRFNGVNRSPLAPTKGFLARQFLGLPFRFNITIKAPFRGLMSSAKGFTDPMILINRARPLPDDVADDVPNQNPVQPSESGPK